MVKNPENDLRIFFAPTPIDLFSYICYSRQFFLFLHPEKFLEPCTEVTPADNYE